MATLETFDSHDPRGRPPKSSSLLNLSFVAQFCMALGSGLLDSVLDPLVAALNPEHRTIAINWLYAFSFAGAVLTTLIGSAALRAGWSWGKNCLSFYLLPLALTPTFAWLHSLPSSPTAVIWTGGL